MKFQGLTHNASFHTRRRDSFAMLASKITHDCQIDLVTVFDAILTSRQTREKLQCLNENLMSNNFRRTAVLKKILFVN